MRKLLFNTIKAALFTIQDGEELATLESEELTTQGGEENATQEAEENATQAVERHSVIKYVERWNNQVEYAEEEQPFNCPAVFIEFAPITWRTLQRGLREADVQITLHVVIDSRVGRWSDTNTVFEFLDTIHKALFGLHTTEDKRTVDSLCHLKSVTDHDHGELEDNQETYTCHVTDATAYPYTTMSSRNIIFDVGAELQQPANR